MPAPETLRLAEELLQRDLDDTTMISASVLRKVERLQPISQTAFDAMVELTWWER